MKGEGGRMEYKRKRTLDSKNRVVLPKAAMQVAGIREMSDVRITYSKSGIVIKAA